MLIENSFHHFIWIFRQRSSKLTNSSDETDHKTCLLKIYQTIWQKLEDKYLRIKKIENNLVSEC